MGVAAEARKSDLQIVVLCDGGWPDVRGVCCWRNGVSEAFGSLDVEVRKVVWQPPPKAVLATVVVAGGPRRLGWIPTAARQPLGRAYRKGKRSLLRIRRSAIEALRPRNNSGSVDKVKRPTSLPGLEGASIVIAESLRAARAAVKAGTPAYRVWALALPPQWLPDKGHTEFAAELTDVAKRIGGFLTDSELARESIERAVSSLRPRVAIFPPIAHDRTCPACADSAADSTETADLDDSVAQLMLWRDLVHAGSGETAADPLPYSFPAARLRGLTGPWKPAGRPGWESVPSDAPMTMPSGEPSDWSEVQQVACARVVHDLVIVPGPDTPRSARTAVLAGRDLKFAVDLADRLGRRGDLEMMVDDWPGLAKQTEHTAERVAQADAIFAEWARTSAIWLSQHKRPDQFLVVRLHRFELDSPYPQEIAMENVDAVVYIAPLFGRRIRDELGWPVEKLLYIPNFLEVDYWERPKLPDAQFTLGFVGLEFIRKRFDLALDMLAEIRREDPRFRMAVRGAMPWRNKYAWEDDSERDYVGWCFERIDRDPLLRNAVVFNSPGRDMARWFRGVGYIVSTSDEEGSHASVAEGMASGAIPVVRPWPGAAEIYDKQWVHDSIGEAANAVLMNADLEVWAQNSARAAAEIRSTHNPDFVVEAWANLLHGDVAGARRYFEEYSRLSD